MNTLIQERIVERSCFKSLNITPKNCRKTRCIGCSLVNLNYKFLALLFYRLVRVLYFVGYSSTLKDCLLVRKQNKSDTKGLIDRSKAKLVPAIRDDKSLVLNENLAQRIKCTLPFTGFGLPVQPK